MGGNRSTLSPLVSFLKWLFQRRRFGNPVIIVSGLPRSGTSMLMSMLSAGGVPLVVDGVRTPDQDNPKGYYELEQVKMLDKPGNKTWLGRARGKGIKIISSLLVDLPATYDYKVIFLRRNLPEVLASQRTMLERRGEAPGETSDEDLADMFAAHLSTVEHLMAARDNIDVMYVEYRQAIDNPGRVADAINTFLGGQLDVEAMATVVDSQLYRNRA